MERHDFTLKEKFIHSSATVVFFARFTFPRFPFHDTGSAISVQRLFPHRLHPDNNRNRRVMPTQPFYVFPGLFGEFKNQKKVNPPANRQNRIEITQRLFNVVNVVDIHCPALGSSRPLRWYGEIAINSARPIRKAIRILADYTVDHLKSTDKESFPGVHPKPSVNHPNLVFVQKCTKLFGFAWSLNTLQSHAWYQFFALLQNVIETTSSLVGLLYRLAVKVKKNFVGSSPLLQLHFTSLTWLSAIPSA